MIASTEKKKKKTVGKKENHLPITAAKTSISKQARNPRSCSRRGAGSVRETSVVPSYSCRPSAHPPCDVSKRKTSFSDTFSLRKGPGERYLAVYYRISRTRFLSLYFSSDKCGQIWFKRSTYIYIYPYLEKEHE